MRLPSARYAAVRATRASWLGLGLAGSGLGSGIGLGIGLGLGLGLGLELGLEGDEGVHDRIVEQHTWFGLGSGLGSGFGLG